MASLAANTATALDDPDRAVFDALNCPIGRPPLREWVRPGERVAVVTSDATRPALQHAYLPQILAELEAAGLAREDVLLVVALGTHRPPTHEEIHMLLGEAANLYPVAWSDCDDEASLVMFGTTSRGTPVRIFRPVAEADRVILTGSIHHHVLAGFSAGLKSLLPGIAARDSIQANHSLVLNPLPEGGPNPRCAAGVLDGNPLYEDFVEAATLFPKPLFLVNVVPAPHGGLLQVVAGDPQAAHLSGSHTAATYYSIPVEAPRPLVFASCGGHPLDMVFYQSTKGLMNLRLALADGGVGVLLAACSQGLGADTLLDFLRLGEPHVIEARLRSAFSVPGYIALVLASLVRRAKIILFSDLNPDLVRELGLIPAGSPQAAMSLARELSGEQVQGYLLPQASITVPTCS